MDIHIILWLVTVVCAAIVWSRKLGQRAEIATVTVAILALVLSFLQSDFIGLDVIDDIYNNEDWLFVFFATLGIGSFFVVSSLAIIPIFVLIFFLIGKRKETNLSVSLLEKSEPKPGGVLYFDVKWSGSMNMGYFTMDVAGRFDEYVKSRHYDTAKKCGNLCDKNIGFGWKYVIPADFTPGECSITIKARHTIKLFIFFLSVQHTLKEYEFDCFIKDVP